MKKYCALLVFILITNSVFATDFRVSNEKELTEANSKARAGDVITLRAGIWDAVQIKITCNGNETATITVRGASYGTTIISGESNLRISGDFVVVQDLVFENGYAAKSHVWSFSAGDDVANNSRITNCAIRGFNREDRMEENHWVTFSGKRNRVDHCAFVDKTNIGVLVAVLMDDERSRNSFHSIDSNFFGIRKPLGSNGGEMIRVGVSQHCTFYSNTDIHDNFFEQCDGETEIISIKSCGNKVRNNVFKECQGSVVLRHGNYNVVESNVFLGNGKTGTGGVRIINENNIVINNFFFECTGTAFRAPLAIMNGVLNSPPNRYLPVKYALIANNSFFNCAAISIGEGADAERTVAPENVLLINNLFYSNKNKIVGFTKSALNGLKIKNNVASGIYIDSLGRSMSKAAINLKRSKSFEMPASAAQFEIDALPETLQNQSGEMLSTALSMNAGTSSFAAYEKMITYGAIIKNRLITKLNKANYFSMQARQCSTAEEVYAAIEQSSSPTIELVSASYTFERPLILRSSLSIRTRGTAVELKYVGTGAFIQLSKNSRLSISRARFKNLILPGGSFILANSAGKVNHAAVNIRDCVFEEMDIESFIRFEKTAYADYINIINTTFYNTKGILVSLNAEDGEKGFYNVEKLTMEGNDIRNHTGQILSLHRTGTDESTMGPALSFTRNNLQNVKASQALIDLFGVQRSGIVQNNFINANTSGALISYQDNTQAVHILSGNVQKNSGTITKNQFVNQ